MQNAHGQAIHPPAVDGAPADPGGGRAALGVAPGECAAYLWTGERVARLRWRCLAVDGPHALDLFDLDALAGRGGVDGGSGDDHRRLVDPDADAAGPDVHAGAVPGAHVHADRDQRQGPDRGAAVIDRDWPEPMDYGEW
jgi:hypothetical protein